MATSFKPCSVDGCNGNAHWDAHGKRGFCASHYSRLRRHGDPTLGKREKGEALRWAIEVAATHTVSDCLIWPFARSRDTGYGRLYYDGRTQPAHRVVCEIAHGKAPSNDHQAAHSCGKGHDGCVAATHLRWATPLENQADRAIHETVPRGESHGLSKMTEDDVRLLRKLAALGSSGQAMASRFGISKSAACRIITRKTWAWLA